MTAPTVMVVVARGTNRDGELALAFELAGARVERVPMAELAVRPERLREAQLLALPGGFSHGDALGAGRLFALDLLTGLGEELARHTERGRPVLGVCNGFQALVASGLLPGGRGEGSLTINHRGHFECRWVELAPDPTTRSVWLDGLDEPLRCPVAHGEGRWVGDADAVALRYADAKGEPAGGQYPANPNGSTDDVAGVCDPTGLILGLMPHPEDHVRPRHDPDRRRTGGRGSCLPLFRNGVAAAAAT